MTVLFRWVGIPEANVAGTFLRAEALRQPEGKRSNGLEVPLATGKSAPTKRSNELVQLLGQPNRKRFNDLGNFPSSQETPMSRNSEAGFHEPTSTRRYYTTKHENVQLAWRFYRIFPRNLQNSSENRKNGNRKGFMGNQKDFMDHWKDFSHRLVFTGNRLGVYRHRPAFTGTSLETLVFFSDSCSSFLVSIKVAVSDTCPLIFVCPGCIIGFNAGKFPPNGKLSPTPNGPPSPKTRNHLTRRTTCFREDRS